MGDVAHRCGALLVTAGWAAAGCGAVHRAERYPDSPLPVPARFAGNVATSSVATGRWWASFRDEGLNASIGRMFAGNLGLRQAFAVIDQAKATLRSARAGGWPQITYDVNVAQSRSIFNFGGGGPSPQGGAFGVTQNQFNASLAASYEVDLWGRVRSLNRSARATLDATRHDLEALAMSLSALTADAWYGLIESRAAEALVRSQIETNRTQLELVELRFRQGLATALDVFQQRQAVAASTGLLPNIVGAQRLFENQIGVLVGRTPGGVVDAPHALPTLPPLPALGVPAAVLAQRPDVQAAQARVAAADFSVGAAIADRFPAIRLTASGGTRSFEFEDMFENWFWNLLGGLAGPLFDGGRRAAEVERNRAVLEGQLAAYADTVLAALYDVENAFVQEVSARRTLAEIAKQRALAASTWREARARYLNGLSDYLPVLTALQALQRLEQSELSARRTVISRRIQLHRALGGSWMSEIERPGLLSIQASEDPS